MPLSVLIFGYIATESDVNSFSLEGRDFLGGGIVFCNFLLLVCVCVTRQHSVWYV